MSLSCLIWPPYCYVNFIPFVGYFFIFLSKIFSVPYLNDCVYRGKLMFRKWKEVLDIQKASV